MMRLAVICATVVAALALPAPVVSAEPSERRLPVDTARATFQRPERCDQPVTTDPRGDGAIDITRVEVRSDCSVWFFDIELARSLTRNDRTQLSVEFDLDRNRRTGCRGADRVAVITNFGYAEATVHMYDLSGCRRTQWEVLPNPQATIGTDSARFEFLPAVIAPDSWFRWRVVASPLGGAVGRDVAPNGWANAYLAPSVVRAVRADVDFDDVSISWIEPARTFGLPITGYEVTYGRSGSQRTITLPRLPRTARSVEVTGLIPGVSYSFNVTALNRFGASEPRGVMAQPFGQPGAPLDLAVVTYEDGRRDLTWRQNPDNGGRLMRRYQVTMSTDGGPFVKLHQYWHLMTALRLPELTPGSTNTVRIIANNGEAASAPAFLEIQIPPAPRPVGIDPAEFAAFRAERPPSTERPAAPRAMSYTSGVCDQAPLRDRLGDGPIDLVGVYVTSDCTDWEFIIETAAPVQFDEDDLVFVNIDNDLDTTTGCGGADVFLVALNDGSGLEAEAYRSRGCTRDTWSNLADPDVQFPLGAFSLGSRTSTLGIEGPFRWYVETYAAQGAEQADFAPDRVWRTGGMAPSQVRSLRTRVRGTTVTATWQPPRTDRGLPVLRHDVSYRESGSSRWIRVRAVGPKARQVQLRGLRAGAQYQLRVVPVNGFGPGQSATSVFQLVGPPGPVRDLDARVNDDGWAIIDWEPPSFDGRRPLETYHATLSVDGAEAVVIRSAQRLGTSRIIPLIEIGRRYVVRVWADNGLFEGPPTLIEILRVS